MTPEILFVYPERFVHKWRQRYYLNTQNGLSQNDVTYFLLNPTNWTKIERQIVNDVPIINLVYTDCLWTFWQHVFQWHLNKKSTLKKNTFRQVFQTHIRAACLRPLLKKYDVSHGSVIFLYCVQKIVAFKTKISILQFYLHV